ncbi:MAG: hypothetical protein ACRDLV_03645 [Solirubrobacteraceae bacterium]
MSTTDSTATVADTLREIAAWLDTHLELESECGHVWVRARGRADLEVLAAALGDRATERCDGNSVRIEGRFGGDRPSNSVTVSGNVLLSQLGAQTPAPVYEPILGSDT